MGRSRPRCWFIGLLLGVSSWAGSAEEPAARPGPSAANAKDSLGFEAGHSKRISFNRDIRPILAETCFECHGPDPKTRQADLRLDTPDGAMADRDGVVAVAPGDPESSELLQRIAARDEDSRMPPPETGERLSEAQMALLRRWIAEGAEYERHWSFEPVRRPPLPRVKQTAWVRNAIDHFVLARLESLDVAPSPPADRYTLIRRVYLDFLGLPPTIEEADAFVRDENPDAYGKLLDRVLAKSRFGERWSRHWLDQARYADSHGYTNDNERSIWPFRDWVINAFNRDLSFDQFTIEQLAGDLLPEPSREQLVATGFHRNTLINSEGGTKADQFRDEQVKDRVDTTGGVWLGLTVGCAKCHSHKYDPITQKEYYQLYAFFNSTADNNSIVPTIKAPSDDQVRHLTELETRHADLKRQLNEDRGRVARQRAWEATLSTPATEPGAGGSSSGTTTKWTVLDLDGKSLHDASFAKLEDGSLLVHGENLAQDEYQLTARSPLTTIRSVRLEALPHGDLPGGGPGRAGNGNFVLSEIWFRTGDGRELRFAKAQADHSQSQYDVAGAIDGNTNTGWAVNGAPEGGAHHRRTAWFVLPSPLELEEGHAITFTLQFNNGELVYNLGRLRLSVSPTEYVDTPSADELATLARIPADRRTPAQQKRLDETFVKTDPKLHPIDDALQRVAKQREQLERQVPTTMVLRELDAPRPAHVQIRGDFLRRGEPVEPNVPAVLPPLPDTPHRPTRLDLARWLMRSDHPLTSRVRMNRIWMRLFGTGLVETENDFGTQGTLPSHPQLLDWLASEFTRRQWSTKQMLRLIANSATYRQASRARPDLKSIDPRNRLLARQNRIRVEAEIVRDLGLAVSGLLSNKIGGPSVHPPQPDGVYAFTQRKKNWRISPGEDRYRRGMYTFFYRSAPYPMLTTFDAPRFNQTCTRRDRSNTPLQSLVVANDETMFEMAQALARRVSRSGPGGQGDVDRVVCMFRRCFTRFPHEDERDFLVEFLNRQRHDFAARPAAARAVAGDLADAIPATDAAAWVATARVLLNLDEFITRE